MFRETDHLGDRARHVIKTAVVLGALVGVYQVVAVANGIVHAVLAVPVGFCARIPPDDAGGDGGRIL